MFQRTLVVDLLLFKVSSLQQAQYDQGVKVILSVCQILVAPPVVRGRVQLHWGPTQATDLGQPWGPPLGSDLWLSAPGHPQQDRDRPQPLVQDQDLGRADRLQEKKVSWEKIFKALPFYCIVGHLSELCEKCK